MRLVRPLALLACLAASAVAALAAASAEAATLDRLKAGEPLRLGYRADAVPFSFKDTLGEPSGFSVQLCRAVAADIKQQLGLADLAIQYVEVAAAERFDKVTGGGVDLLCETATITLQRRETVDFSLPIFVTGAGLLYRADGPTSFEQLKGKRVGVLAGTTTETGIKEAFAREGTQLDVVEVASHEEGMAKLVANEIQAYFADHAILVFLLAQSPDKDKIKISPRYLSLETYGLAMAKGDEDFRLAVDRGLSRVYRSDMLGRLFHASFGEAEPSELLTSLYRLNALPE